ncbi:MAG: hypothetical protein OHK93_008610 [Ramalina farinacea]|uniref:Uncharacterized protein n=1 Tax=Ramalina farinacea TaxID=258253 RepID=A0AA43TYN3_9LECA|nr:hypothetical protein [Ramalina farinacea]
MPAGFPNIRHDPTKPDAQAILRARQQQQQSQSSSSSSERKSKYQFPIEKDDRKSTKEVDSQSVNTQSSRTGLLGRMTKR